MPNILDCFDRQAIRMNDRILIIHRYVEKYRPHIDNFLRLIAIGHPAGFDCLAVIARNREISLHLLKNIGYIFKKNKNNHLGNYCQPPETVIEKKDRFGNLYRSAVYALLGLLIVSGAILSNLMTQTTQDVRAATVPLLRKEILTLEEVSQFEKALLQHQLAMNKYFAGSINRERLIELQLQTKNDMNRHFSFLKKNISPRPVLSELDSNYQQLMTLRFYFEKDNLFSGVNQRAAKAALFEINLCINNIFQQLEDIKNQTETMLYRSEDSTTADVGHIGNLIYLFSGGILLTGLFMLYHVWARFRSEDRLAFQANHDPLTGLPHRRSFEHRLRKLAFVPHTVVLGRIDRFERVIGSLGHEMADTMIQQITSRIQQIAVRHGAAVFRLDGANIAILYKMSGDELVLQAALTDLRDEMRRPFLLGRHEVFSSLSLGAAEYPLHGAEPVQLLKNADAALRKR